MQLFESAVLEECCKSITSLLESLNDAIGPRDPLQSGNVEEMTEAKAVESISINIATMWKEHFDRHSSLSHEVSHLQASMTKELASLRGEVRYLRSKLEVSVEL